MRSLARPLTLLLGISLLLAACDSSPAPSVKRTASPSATPAATATPAGPTATPTPTPVPTATPVPGDLTHVPWAFLQPLAGANGKVDHARLYLGFAGHPASVSLALTGVHATYQLFGDLALVIANFGGKTTSFRIFRVTDGSVFWDAAQAHVGVPDGDFRFDARANQLYFAVPTDVGGVEFHRFNMSDGQDTVLLAFGRPFGETWADQDHSYSMGVDISRPGYVHYLVCTNGVDRSACTFYVAGPKDTSATEEAVVTGNQTALCNIVGVDAHYAFTAETSGKCSTKPAESFSMRVTDLTTGQSRPVLYDTKTKRGPALTRPQVVTTSDGVRLVYTIVPKGHSRVLAAYDPVRGIATVLPFTIDTGGSLDPARAIVLVPITDAAIAGHILVAPVYANGLTPVPHSLWGNDTPTPALIDVLSGAATRTDVWDPGKLAPTP